MIKVDEDEIMRLHRCRLSAQEIAIRVGCSARTVLRVRARNGVTQPPAEFTGPITPERLAEAERMLDDGASYEEVKRTLHMHQRTLVKYFPGRGWDGKQTAQYRQMVTQLNALEWAA